MGLMVEGSFAVTCSQSKTLGSLFQSMLSAARPRDPSDKVVSHAMLHQVVKPPRH
jgi:hypothetical protein